MTLVRLAHDGLGRALCDYAAAALAALGTQVDDPIRFGHDVEIVFDHDDGVAGVDQAVQDAHEHGTQAHHDAPGEISVPAHGVAVTWWKVTGNTMFGCHMPGHWDYGMRGVIIAT